jgi:hypothetical protein
VCALAACAPPKYRSDAEVEAGADLEAGADDDAVDAEMDAEEPTDAGSQQASEDAGADGAQLAQSGDGEAGAGMDAAQGAETGAPESSVAVAQDAEAGAEEASADTGVGALDPDAWAGPLLGRYVARSDAYIRDPFSGVASYIKEILLVNIERTDDEVWLTAQTCAWDASNEWGKVKLVRPSAVPPRHERVRYADGRWRTEPGLQALGYNVESPPICAGKEGLSVAKQPGQSWLAEACSCATSNVSLPGIEDCRVTDPDGDAKPGITYAFVSPLGDKTDIHVVREFRFHLQDGTISATGRHGAHEVQPQRSLQLSCYPTNCLNIANNSVPCPPSNNRMQFARLASDAGSATCEQALMQASSELAYDMPDKPSNCPK